MVNEDFHFISRFIRRYAPVAARQAQVVNRRASLASGNTQRQRRRRPYCIKSCSGAAKLLFLV